MDVTILFRRISNSCDTISEDDARDEKTTSSKEEKLRAEAEEIAKQRKKD